MNDREGEGVSAPPARQYVDPATLRRYPLDTPRWRGEDGGNGPRGPLMLTELPCGVARADLDDTAPGLWRYRAAFALPVTEPVSLGEGRTPLVPRAWGGGRPSFKLEWFSPTGSFKDRGASVMLSSLRQQGVTRVIEDSSGNGGAAIAGYAAAAGMEATVFAPASTSPAKLVQARAYGARIVGVEGPREASQTAAIEAAERGEGFYASHNWHPFFLEGTKTLAYELWEDLGHRAPDSVVMPVGAGSSLLGCAIGFGELLRAGLIDRLPRLFAAQPLNCSPVDAAFKATPRTVSQTIAEGASIARPLRLREMLDALRESGGGTVAVTEDEIAAAHADLAKLGLYAEPTSAVAAAGYEALVRRGVTLPDENTVIILTGSGLKSQLHVT